MIAVLLVDPLAMLGAGFWLSFAGVAWLVWCLPGARADTRRVLRTFLSAQGVATLGLLPLSAVLFGQASLAGPFANLVAIPVVEPGGRAAGAARHRAGGVARGWGAWAWRLAAAAFDLSWPLVRAPRRQRLCPVVAAGAALVRVAAGAVRAFWLLLPRGVPGKALALLLWLPLLWPQRDLPREGEAELVDARRRPRPVGAGTHRAAHAALRHGAGGARMASTPANAPWCRPCTHSAWHGSMPR